MGDELSLTRQLGSVLQDKARGEGKMNKTTIKDRAMKKSFYLLLPLAFSAFAGIDAAPVQATTSLSPNRAAKNR